MDTNKLLSLMRFWLFGTFIIVFVATTTYAWLYAQKDLWIALKSGLPVWGLTAVLCIVWFFVYRLYIQSRS